MLTPRTTVRPPYDFVSSCVCSVDVIASRAMAGAWRAGARLEWRARLRLGAACLVAVDDNSVGRLEEGQRSSRGLAARLAERHRRRASSRHDVALFLRVIRQAAAGCGPRPKHDRHSRIGLQTVDRRCLRARTTSIRSARRSPSGPLTWASGDGRSLSGCRFDSASTVGHRPRSLVVSDLVGAPVRSALCRASTSNGPIRTRPGRPSAGRGRAGLREWRYHPGPAWHFLRTPRARCCPL